MNNPEFWLALDQLIHDSNIIIDRPKGSRHPRHATIVYAVDYGYLENTKSMDDGGIDVWRGSGPEGRCDAIVCTIDLLKRDSEMKILIGCTEEEKRKVLRFHNESAHMKGIMFRRE